MKKFLILLALGYVSSEKLGLGYLPPPGSQYAGGRPEDIQIPFEIPNDTSYSTTLRPQIGDNRLVNPGDYQATIGIDRVPPGVPDVSIGTSGSPPVPNFQNQPKVPTTTVSYAFTQTTTHPPTEGFETTIGPQMSGFPTTDIFNNFSSQEPGLNNEQNLPGFIQTVDQFGRPTIAPTSGSTLGNIPPQQPGLGYEGSLNAQSHPGYKETINQFGQPILVPTSGPVTQFTGLPNAPQQPGLGYEGNLNAQTRPGYKETINQFGQPILVPTSGPVTQFTGSPIPSVGPTGQQFLASNRPDQQQLLTQFQPGFPQSGSGLPGVSPTPFEQQQYRNQSVSGNLGLANQPGYVPSTVTPEGFISTSQPGRIVPGFQNNNLQSNFPGQLTQIPTGQQQLVIQQYPGPQSGYQPSSTVAPTFTPGLSNQQSYSTSISPGSGFPGDTQYTSGGNKAGTQQYPGSQTFPGAAGNRETAFQPSSTAAPIIPGISNQDFTGTSIAPGKQFPYSATSSSHLSPAYPNAQANAASSVYRNRPERPQAEADRNAVILNYENVITPEGFAYSFDTSNGIHADESGTATDGVKAKGSYSYIGDDGKEYSVVYTADEDGFRPQGDHLPTPPPVPEAIQRIIEQVEKEKQAGISHDGSYDEDKYGHKKYQGAMGRRPQLSNGMTTNANDFAEDDVPQKTSQAKNRLRPERPQIRPTVPEGETIYNEDNSESSLTNYGQNTNYDNQREPGQISTQRPITHVTDSDTEDNEGGDLERIIEDNRRLDQHSTTRPNIEVSSKRPISQSVRKQYNTINVPGAKEGPIRGENQKRPISRRPVIQDTKQDQDIEYDGPDYEDGIIKNRYVNKGPSRRPGNYEENDQYENGGISTPDSYEDENNSNRPTTGLFRRPTANVATENDDVINRQVFDKYGRPVKTPIRRPVAGKDSVNTQYGSDRIYDKPSGGKKRPSNKPFTHSSDEFNTPTDEYGSEQDFVTKSPSRLRPGGSKPSNRYSSRDQNVPVGVRRRPSSSAIRMRPTEKNVEYQPNEEEYLDSNNESQDYDNRRLTSSDKVPSTTTESQYEDIDQELEHFIPTQGGYTGRPMITSSPKYSGSRGRPQNKPHVTINDGRIQESGDKRLNGARPGTKFGQTIVRPGFNQQVGYIDDENDSKRPLNGTGYQYIPPQQKFEGDEVTGFPTRTMGTTRRPFTGRPTPSVYYEDTDKPSKPFMTPNVSTMRDQVIASRRPGVTSTTQKPGINQYDDENDSQYPGGNKSDQIFEDDEISSTGPSSQFPSSTYRPVQQQSTRRPQYTEQYTQNVPGLTKQQIIQKGRPTHSQDTNNRDYKGTTKIPSGIVSSTTPIPPTRPYGTMIERERPGQGNNVYYTNDGQGFISSTTPLPSQSPTVDGSYQQGTIQPQYQTTYRPSETIRPTTEYEDGTTVQRLPSAGPSINITPGISNNKYQGNLPSTTYRPNYSITGQDQPSSTAKPNVLVDRYGRPINKIGSGTTSQEYLPNGQYQPFSTMRPSVTVDAYGRPTNQPGSASTVEEYLPGGLNQASTLRPGVAIDGFGRPINRPGSTIVDQEYVTGGLEPRPGVLVDAYGRPVQPTPGAIQEYGPGRQSQPSSIATPGVLVDAYGRPVPTPGSISQEYSPGLSTPKSEQGVIIGNKELGQYQPGNDLTGQQEYEQGITSIGSQGYPSSTTLAPNFRGEQKYRPGLSQGSISQTFQPSTERVIGEDFSGPKQQQKFDPETGYYYK